MFFIQFSPIPVATSSILAPLVYRSNAKQWISANLSSWHILVACSHHQRVSAMPCAVFPQLCHSDRELHSSAFFPCLRNSQPLPTTDLSLHTILLTLSQSCLPYCEVALTKLTFIWCHEQQFPNPNIPGSLLFVVETHGAIFCKNLQILRFRNCYWWVETFMWERMTTNRLRSRMTNWWIICKLNGCHGLSRVQPSLDSELCPQ